MLAAAVVVVVVVVVVDVDVVVVGLWLLLVVLGEGFFAGVVVIVPLLSCCCCCCCCDDDDDDDGGGSSCCCCCKFSWGCLLALLDATDSRRSWLVLAGVVALFAFGFPLETTTGVRRWFDDGKDLAARSLALFSLLTVAVWLPNRLLN